MPLPFWTAKPDPVRLYGGAKGVGVAVDHAAHAQDRVAVVIVVEAHEMDGVGVLGAAGDLDVDRLALVQVDHRQVAAALVGGEVVLVIERIADRHRKRQAGAGHQHRAVALRRDVNVGPVGDGAVGVEQGEMELLVVGQEQRLAELQQLYAAVARASSPAGRASHRRC